MNRSLKAAHLHARNCAASLAAPYAHGPAGISPHPLARWSEGEFGVEPEEGGRLRRRVPRTLTDAAARLARRRARPRKSAGNSLRELLTRGGELGATTADGPSPSSCTSSSARAAPCFPPLNRPPPASFRLKGRRCRPGPTLRAHQVLPPVRPGLLPRRRLPRWLSIPCRIPLGMDTIEDGDAGRLSDARPAGKRLERGSHSRRMARPARTPQADLARPRPAGRVGQPQRRLLHHAPRRGNQDVVAASAVLALPELRRVLHRPGTGIRQTGFALQ